MLDQNNAIARSSHTADTASITNEDCTFYVQAVYIFLEAMDVCWMAKYLRIVTKLKIIFVIM